MSILLSIIKFGKITHNLRRKIGGYTAASSSISCFFKISLYCSRSYLYRSNEPTDLLKYNFKLSPISRKLSTVASSNGFRFSSADDAVQPSLRSRQIYLVNCRKTSETLHGLSKITCFSFFVMFSQSLTNFNLIWDGTVTLNCEECLESCS